MALHDNPLWILSHIQNSFVVSDNTANSQLLLTNDHKPYLNDLAQREGIDIRHEKCLNPFGDESNSSDDELSRSVEIRAGNRMRPRCNTERKLEKMKNDRKKEMPVRTISWRESEQINEPPFELSELFPKKKRNPVTKTTPKKSSLLSAKIETSPQIAENPFADFSRFDASENTSESLTLRVLLTALMASEKEDSTSGGGTSSSTPTSSDFIEGRVHHQTLVKDAVGFICWKYTDEGREPPLKDFSVDNYSLYLADADGSIDWDLRPLEKSEPISRFGFTDYALVHAEKESQRTGDIEIKVTLPDGTYTVIRLLTKDITAQAVIDKVLSRHKIKQRSGVSHQFHLEAKSQSDKPMEATQSLHTVEDNEFFIVRENSRRCTEFEPTDQDKFAEFYPVDASTYQEYRDVWLMIKMPIRSRIGVVIAISQDRFDIFPHQTPSSRIWSAAQSIPKEGNFGMEQIAACEITEKNDEEHELWTFRLVIEHKYNSYKKVYFQGTKDVVNEIHNKMSNLLQWHSSQARSNYIVYKEMKSRRRKTNIF